MSNFTDFFPAASAVTGGGGGGFTKQNKYSTNRALNDSTYKLSGLRNNGGSLVTDGSAGTLFDLIYDQPAQSIAAAPSTYTIRNLRFDSSTALNVGAVIPANFFAGGTVRFSYSGINNINLQQPSLISSHPEFTYVDSNSSLVLSYSTNPQGAYSALAKNNLGTGDTIPLVTSTSFTVNPATDLGLEDGSQIGYMLVGAGYSSGDNNYGGRGGKIISGTATIVTASTDLILTPGVANGGSSTISGGGLALSSGDGSNAAGFSDLNVGNSVVFTAGSGNMGYGAGGGRYNGSRNSGTNYHGYGVGAFTTGTGGDGAILLSY